MDDTQTHEEVSRVYTEALRGSRAGGTRGCCAPADEPCSAGAVAELAGYGPEREAYPEQAASSFGCGNPLAFAAVEPGQSVLDLGSGAGLDLLIAAQKVGPTGKVIGVDMTGAMIEAAREAAARAGLENVEVREGLIEKLPVEDASVDWVISNCVINLSPRKDEVFREIHRVLKPGGRLSISDIVVQDLPDWIRGSAAAYTSCVAGAISEQDYVQGLRDAGLTDLEVGERLVYEPEQIRAIVEGELPGPAPDGEQLEKALAEVKGKVWSARLTGRKPPTAAREGEALTSKEKTLIALAAAMGGGCRTCADKLYAAAQSVDASADELERAFAEGLRQRESATRLMREKAEALLGRAVNAPGSPRDTTACVAELSRFAASVAANAAPDALEQIEAARAAGATEAELKVAIGIAHAIRSKAQGFSDAELGDSPTEDPGCGCG